MDKKEEEKNQVDLIAAMQTIPWFQEFSSEHFEKLVEIACLIEVDAKQELFHEGGPEDFLYSCLIRLDAFALRQLCEEDSGLGYIVMTRMANVVASRLLTTRLQLLDMFAHPESKEGRHA